MESCKVTHFSNQYFRKNLYVYRILQPYLNTCISLFIAHCFPTRVIICFSKNKEEKNECYFFPFVLNRAQRVQESKKP